MSPDVAFLLGALIGMLVCALVSSGLLPRMVVYAAACVIWPFWWAWEKWADRPRERRAKSRVILDSRR